MGATSLQSHPTPDNSSVFGVPADMLALGNSIEKYTVMRFTTAVARDAAISSPEEGMVAALTTDNQVTWHNGVGWRPGPWNAPWGIIGYAERTTQQTGITAEVDVTGLSVTWTAVANRRYRISAQSLLYSSVANDSCQIRITDGSNNIQTLAQVVSVSTTIGTNAVTSVIQTPAAGSVTRKVRAMRNTGTGNVTFDAGAVYPAFILVEDIGPNGVPA